MPGLRQPRGFPRRYGAPGLGLRPGLDLLRRLDETAHRAHGFVEHRLFLWVERDLDDALDALGADPHGPADIEVLDAVLPGEPSGAGQHALLVAEIGFGHGDRRGCRRVEGRAGLEQIDDLAAAAARALHDLVDALLRGPAHL